MKIQLKNFSVTNFYDNCNVTFNQGVTGVVGNNGSGKSLLCHYLIGIYNNYDGDIIFDDVVLTNQNFDTLISQIKLLTHNPENQFLGHSVYDEVSYKLFQNGFTKEQISDVYLDFFSDFDPNMIISTMHYEKQIKLLILSLICLRPAFLIIDEGLSICSDDFKMEIFELLKSHDVSVIYVTNNIYDTQFCNFTYVLEDRCFKLYEKQLNFDFNYLPISDTSILKYSDAMFDFDLFLGLNISSVIPYSAVLKLVDRCLFDLSIGLVDRYGLSQAYFIYVYQMFKSSGVSWSIIYETLQFLGFDKMLFSRELNTLSTGQLIFTLFIFQVLLGRDLIVFNYTFEVLDSSVREVIINYCFDNSISLLVVTNNILIFNGCSCNFIGDDCYVL